MFIQIGSWPKESTITHDSTTWKMTSDLDGIDVILESVEDRDNLDSWMVDILIPTGTIYYITATRHLLDANGAIVNDVPIIGPKPVFNPESNKNDYLVPRYTIDDPFIEDITYGYGESLKITVGAYRGDVDYTGTAIQLLDITNSVIYNEIVDLTMLEDSIITISNDEIDFINQNVVKVIVCHTGNHSVVSKPVSEVVLLNRVLYMLEGNKFNVDPNLGSDLILKSISNIGITLDKVELLTVDDILLEEYEVIENKVKVGVGLDFNASYKLKLTIKYIQENGVEDTMIDYCSLTTIALNESLGIDENFVYSHMLSTLPKYEDGDTRDIINLDVDYNTEEIFTNITPLPGKEGNLILPLYSTINNYIISNKESDIVIDGDFTIRLVNKSNGYISRVNDGVVVVDVFEYNSYSDAIVIKGTVSTDIKGTTGVINRVAELNNRYYIIGASLTSTNTILVQELDIVTGSLTDVTTYTLNNDITEISIAGISDDRILIFPVGENEIRSYVFSANVGEITKGLVIPTTFQNTRLITTRLRNGDILCMRYDESARPLDYCFFKLADSKFISKTINYTGTGKISNQILLRSGELIFILATDNGNMVFKLQ